MTLCAIVRMGRDEQRRSKDDAGNLVRGCFAEHSFCADSSLDVNILVAFDGGLWLRDLIFIDTYLIFILTCA